jgi:hypothetical protein
MCTVGFGDYTGYGLGHFLGENSDQILAGIQLRPIPKLRFIMEFERWRKGPEHVFGASAANLSGAQFMERSIAASSRLAVRVRYQIINDLSVQLMVNHWAGNTDGTFTFPGVDAVGASNTWFGFGISVGY